MGRFTLPLQKKILILLSFICLSAFAKEVENLNIDENKECEGISMPLQGSGIRKATIFGIKIYFLAFYAPAPIANLKDPNLSKRPMCFDIYYLRDFSDEDVDRAWAFQFKESSHFPYPHIEGHVEEIQKNFGEIKGKRLQSFVLTTGTTKMYENGTLKGEIKGSEFQKNFLSIWFGPKPPSEELQQGLLKN